MAKKGNVEIIFRMNRKTGKKDIIFDYDKDPESMRHEHERKHRELMKQLIGDAEGLEIERLDPSKEAPPIAEDYQEPEALGNQG